MPSSRIYKVGVRQIRASIALYVLRTYHTHILRQTLITAINISCTLGNRTARSIQYTLHTCRYMCTIHRKGFFLLARLTGPLPPPPPVCLKQPVDANGVPLSPRMIRCTQPGIAAASPYVCVLVPLPPLSFFLPHARGSRFPPMSFLPSLGSVGRQP